MLPHAMLIITTSAGMIYIPVINFPVLPKGSIIDLYVTDEVAIEGVSLETYIASNTRGVEIELDGTKAESSQGGSPDDDWNKLRMLCITDPNDRHRRIYPHVLDYGIKFPLPPT